MLVYADIADQQRSKAFCAVKFFEFDVVKNAIVHVLEVVNQSNETEEFNWVIIVANLERKLAILVASGSLVGEG